MVVDFDEDEDVEYSEEDLEHKEVYETFMLVFNYVFVIFIMVWTLRDLWSIHINIKKCFYCIYYDFEHKEIYELY